MALSKDEADKQVERMIGYIEQQAKECVEEIDAEAEEAFHKEKERLIHEGKKEIEEQYRKKTKDLDMKLKQQTNRHKNQARLTVLREKDQHIQSLLAESKTRLAEAVANSEDYQRLLELLILDGLLQLMEPKIIICCRQRDLKMVRKVIKPVADQYKERTEQSVELSVAEHKFLPEDTSGGVVLYSGQRRICATNTLDSRLEEIAAQMMPEIREQLFGANTNRKFKD